MHTREKFLKWMFNPCTTWFTSKTELVHIQWKLLISASRLLCRVRCRWCSAGILMQVSILFIWKSENNAYRSFHLWVRNLRCSQDVLWLKMINMRKIMFRFFFLREVSLLWGTMKSIFLFAKTNTAGRQILFCSEGVGKSRKGFLFPFNWRDLLSVKGRNH